MSTIGIFDSGIGGLSVLRELQIQLPTNPCVYVADNAFSPYGERDVATVQSRAHRIATYLRSHYQIKALVIACNTATAHAIDALRASHPDLPIIGVEPALKPAATQSASGHIGVLATRGTLSSYRFLHLRTLVESKSGGTVHFWPQACDGLADAIERNHADEVQALSHRYVCDLFNTTPETQLIDTLVLGCTHYPFALEALQAAAKGRELRFIDTGQAVAKRARDLLKLPTPIATHCHTAARPTLLSTSNPQGLSRAAQRWINPLLRARTVVI